MHIICVTCQYLSIIFRKYRIFLILIFIIRKINILFIIYYSIYFYSMRNGFILKELQTNIFSLNKKSLVNI